MAVVSDSDLKASVKCGKIDKVYYLYGKDTAAVEAYKNMIISKVVRKGDEVYNLHVFDGTELDFNELTEACEALPMFAEYVCCVVSDLNAETLSPDQISMLVKMVADLPDTTVLIFYYAAFDIDEAKKNAKNKSSSKNKKLQDAVTKHGTVCEFKFKTADMLAKDIMAKAAKCGGAISRDAAFDLAELCACNTMMVGNELDKLLSYAEGNEITRQMVAMLCPRQIETTSFDLAKAIARRDRASSLRLLNDLNLEKTEPMAVLYAVTGNMLDLYRAKVASGEGKNPSDVMADFKYPGNLSFRVNNAFRDVRKYSTAHLRACMRILVETDVSMKSSKTDKWTLIEEAVVKMLSIR
ncbi:MAG: DNA polymerase III subunit delta [Oscillospiraceae bacterium]